MTDTTSPIHRPELLGSQVEDLRALFPDLPGFKLKQIYRWLHNRGIVDFNEMTDQQKVLRAHLATNTG